MVIPTGLAQIVDTVQGRYVASIVATYGPIRNGQRVLPAEKFVLTGEAHAVPVSDGVRATFIGGPGRQDIKAPQMVVFLDKGSRTASRGATCSRSAAPPSGCPTAASSSTT